MSEMNKEMRYLTPLVGPCGCVDDNEFFLVGENISACRHWIKRYPESIDNAYISILGETLEKLP